MSAAAISKSDVKPVIYPSHEVPRDPQAFFKKVYIHLTDDHDLPKALALIAMGNTSIHKGLTDKNKTMIAEWVEKGSTAHKQASRLVSILKGHSEIFSGVDPDKFSQSGENLPSAAASTPVDKGLENKKETKSGDAATKSKKAGQEKTSGPSESLSSSVSKSPLEIVKELGRLTGLSEDLVNESLEEILLPNQTTVRVIKISHMGSTHLKEVCLTSYDMWKQSLIKLASKKEILFFAEGTVRKDWDENLRCRKLEIADRGYFRGLETDESMFRGSVLAAYPSFIRMKEPMLYRAQELHFQLKIIAGELFVRDCGRQALREAAKTSMAAKKMCEMIEILRNNYKDKLPKDQFPILANKLMKEVPDINDWVEFIETLLPIVYKGWPSEVTAAIDKMIAERKKNNFVQDLLRGDPYHYFNIVIEKIRAPRDRDFGRIFLQELPSLPKDKQVFVMLGANHAPGFKAAVLDAQSSINGDRKADSKLPS